MRKLMTPTEQQEVLNILADSFEQKFGSLFPQKDALKKLTDFPETLRPMISRYRWLIINNTVSSFKHLNEEQFDDDPKTIPCPATHDSSMWRACAISARQSLDYYFDLCVSVEYAFSEMAKNPQTELSMVESPDFKQRMLRFKSTLRDLSKESAAQLIKGFNNLPADHPERHVYLNFFADGFLYLFRKQLTIGCTVGMSLGIGCFGELEHYPGSRSLLAWNDYLPLIQDLFLEHYSWDKFTSSDAARNINEIFWMMNAMSPAEIEWLRAYYAPINSSDITAKQLSKAAETFRKFFEAVLRIKKINPTFELPKPPSFIISFQINSDYLKRITAFMEKNCSNLEISILLIDEISVRNSGTMLTELLDLTRASLVERKATHEFDKLDVPLVRYMITRLSDEALRHFKDDFMMLKTSWSERRDFLFFWSALFKLGWIDNYPTNLQAYPIIEYWRKNLENASFLEGRSSFDSYVEKHFQMLKREPIHKVVHIGLLMMMSRFMVNFVDSSAQQWIDRYFLSVNLNELPIEQVEFGAQSFLQLCEVNHQYVNGKKNFSWYPWSMASPPPRFPMTIASEPDYMQRALLVMQKTTCFKSQRYWLDNLPSITEINQYHLDKKFSQVITRDEAEVSLREHLRTVLDMKTSWIHFECERQFSSVARLGKISTGQMLLGLKKKPQYSATNGESWDLVGLWPYRFNQPFAHFDKPSIANYENNKNLAFEWRNIIIDMPKNPKYIVIKLLNDHLLSQYSWDKLTDSYFYVLQMILYVASPALLNWFKAYFKTLQGNHDSVDVLNATKQFVIFSKLFIRNKLTIAPPTTPIGFLYGSDYLLRITTLMEKSCNPELQMSLIDDVPTLEMLNEAHSIHFFKVLVREQFVNNHLPSWVASSIGALAAQQKERLILIQKRVDLSTFIAESLCWISLYKPEHFLKVRTFFKLLQIEPDLDTEEKKIIAKSVSLYLLSEGLQSPELLPAWMVVVKRLRDEFGLEIVLQLMAIAPEKTDDVLRSFIEIGQHLLNLAPYFNDKLYAAKTKSASADTYQCPEDIFTAESSTKKINFSTVIARLKALKIKDDAARFPQKAMEQLRRDFLTPSETVKFPISEAEYNVLEANLEKILGYAPQYEGQSLKQLGEQARLLGKQLSVVEDKMQMPQAAHLLAIIREAYRQQFGIMPYHEQLMEVMSMLLYPKGLRGRIPQVKTGEGKSSVTTLLATFLACQDRKVDIITSNEYLAKRDQEKFSEFYSHFSITTSHVCYQRPDPSHFEAQILFGTSVNFKFPWLFDGLQMTQTRNGRPCDAAIVDEADNLLIDSVSNSARIANPSSEDVSWVYAPIWQLLLTLKSDAFSRLSANDIRGLLSAYQNGHYARQVSTFSDLRLADWKESAMKAQLNIAGHHYVIENNKIVIVALQTGHLSRGSQWQAGLHQFLELKHNVPISDESDTIAAISHSAFFAMYKTVLGLTGTMGEEVERNEVFDVHHLDTYDAPTHRPILRRYEPGSISVDRAEQIKKLIQSIKAHRDQGRPILVLFSGINETEEFAKQLRAANIPCQILNEVQREDEDYVVARAGIEKTVTIATNAAGRGTDIILSSAAKSAGGLHVIFTFYPDNIRIEEQGFGRAGRQGQPGSGEMILSLEDNFISQLFPTPLSKRRILTSGDNFLNELRERRTEYVRACSEKRKLISAHETMLYGLLEKFMASLSPLKEKLLRIDVKHLEKMMCWGIQTALPTDSFLVLSDHPVTKAVLQKIGVEVGRLCTDSTADKSVSASFIEYLRDAYIKLLLNRWARFFSYVSHHSFHQYSIEEFSQVLNREMEKLKREGYLSVTEKPLESFYGWVSQLSNMESRHDRVHVNRSSGSSALFTTPAQSASNDTCASSAALNNGFD